MRTPDELRKAFWDADIASGGGIYNQFNEVKSILENGDRDWVQKHLQKIKQHAIRTTEFYRNYTDKDVFPVMNKASMLENYDQHKAAEGFETPVHISSTSGSTGIPFRVIQDRKKRMRTIADIKVFGERCNYPSHERMVYFRVITENMHRTPERDEAENIFYVDSSDLSPGYLAEMIQVVLDKKPWIIFSYGSTLVELAKFVREKGIPKESFSGMKSVLTAGEGVSLENLHLLENVFGCRVYRRYGTMDMGILGQDWGDGQAYSLNWGSYYFECLKQDSDIPAAPGEVGRIVVTDLFNYAFPMIRYDTGDLGIMDEMTGEKFPVLRELYGRSRDCVYSTKGMLLSPAKIAEMLTGMEMIKQWQFIQEAQKQYVLKLNADGEVNEGSIREDFKNLLGEDADIMIQNVDEIPVLSSNKRRSVVCNYKR